MKMIGKPFKRPDRNGYYLRWTDPVTHKRLTKTFHTKKLAEHFRQILYYRLNADVFIGAINIPLSEAIKEYLEKYDLRNLSPNSKQNANITLQRLLKLLGDTGTKYISQKHFDHYIKTRSPTVAPRTLNKDIRNLKAFVRWANKTRYIKTEIELYKVKTPPLMNRKALTTEQIRELFRACPNPAWRCRILLSLVTGLRKSDIDSLLVAGLNLKQATLDSQSQKTGKAYIGRPLPKAAVSELKRYIKSLFEGQVRLFADINVRKVWEKIRGDTGITRQDLRRTFATYIQKVGSIGSAQNLLEHYDSRTTTEFYTDQELILRWKVNQLPVKSWLAEKKLQKYAAKSPVLS